LSKGDVLIDGGNTHYQQTERRATSLKEKGILFLGIGVSGGEEGALKGPSLMVGGDQKGYEIVKEDLFLVAAKNSKGNPLLFLLWFRRSRSFCENGSQRNRIC
jgi:6-phosphogluconate dehydrogenase